MDGSSFETFEDELKKTLQENPPQKPVRHTRAEMYTQRRVREEAPIVLQVPKMIPHEHPLSGPTSLRKALSIQNLSQMQMESPWEGVTLNRCLIVAITILLLSSGVQRIHEAIRGQKDVNEELTVLANRHTLLRRGNITPQPDSSLWDTLFWWLDDDDDDDEEKPGKHKVSRSLRHRALPDPRLLKKRKTFTERRGRGEEEEEEIKETQRKIKAKKKIKEEEENMEKKKIKKDSKKKMKAKEEEEEYTENKKKAKKDSKNNPVKKELKQ